MIKVAVFGYGTVGSGVVDVIDDNNELISKRIGDDICVKYILDIREFPGDRNESKIVHDVNVHLASGREVVDQVVDGLLQLSAVTA